MQGTLPGTCAPTLIEKGRRCVLGVFIGAVQAGQTLTHSEQLKHLHSASKPAEKKEKGRFWHWALSCQLNLWSSKMNECLGCMKTPYFMATIARCMRWERVSRKSGVWTLTRWSANLCRPLSPRHTLLHGAGFPLSRSRERPGGWRDNGHIF